MSAAQDSPAYVFTRRIVGVMGMMLPLVLMLGNAIFFHKSPFRVSISSYYYTDMRDVMTGLLFCIALFMLANKWKTYGDNALGVFAFVATVCVAIFPTDPPSPSQTEKLIGELHFLFSAIMFFILAIICFRFINWGKDESALGFTDVITLNWKAEALTPRERAENRLYVICGFAIPGLMLVMLFCYLLLGVETRERFIPIFWLEASAMFAFGFAWLIKGDALALIGKKG
jgi:hypothetical protein